MAFVRFFVFDHRLVVEELTDLDVKLPHVHPLSIRQRYVDYAFACDPAARLNSSNKFLQEDTSVRGSGSQ
jgi:hypothetical protein